MARVAGIQIERSVRGLPLYGRVDFRKHPDMIQTFELKGVEVEKKAISKPPRGYLTHDEFWDSVKKEVHEMCIDNGLLQ